MISRRRFSMSLIGSAGLLCSGFSLALDSLPKDSKTGLLIGGGRYIDLDTGNEEFALSLVTAEDRQPTLIPLNFFAHGVTINPDNPNRILVMEKKGPGCALIDIDSKEVILDLPASEGCWFYGHGAYTKDSSHIYVVETNLGSSKGLLSIRDAESGRIVEEMDTYGANPHDCHLIEKGNFLAITNAGLGKNSSDKNARPCITYIDANSGQLLEKIPLTNTDINAGHLLITDTSDLAVVSAPREELATSSLGGISLKPNGAAMESLAEPNEILDQLEGETLSLAYHAGTDTIAATTPDANLVTFWKMADRSLISAVRLPRPRGVCLNSDQTHFLISAGETTALYSIEAKDLSRIELVNQSSYISGSHLYNWTNMTARR